MGLLTLLKSKKIAFPLVFMLVAVIGVSGFTDIGHKTLEKTTSMVMISHTEYSTGDNGQVVARLMDYKGTPLNGASCYASILYPDKTYFVNNNSMAFSTFDGNYYYNFTTPAQTGVYEYKAECTFTYGAKQFTKSVSNSFHLGEAWNMIRDVYNLTQETNASQTAIHNKLDDMNLTLGDLNTSITNVYNDTQWLTDNVLTLSNFSATEVRIENITSEVQNLLAFCDDSQTNSSLLCQRVNYLYNDVVNNQVTFRNTVTSYLTAINSTTTNTWNKINMNVTVEIDNLQASISGLVQTTGEINTTVNTIKENQEEQFYMVVYSG